MRQGAFDIGHTEGVKVKLQVLCYQNCMVLRDFDRVCNAAAVKLAVLDTIAFGVLCQPEAVDICCQVPCAVSNRAVHGWNRLE